ncbi:MAG: phosphoribosyltransferase family protein [Desulfurococcaceae archaeon]
MRTWYKRVLVTRRPSEMDVKFFTDRLINSHGRSKADRMKLRLLACEVLRLLKPVLSYRDLYKLTALPESVLCRYVKGSVIPSFDHAVRILAKTSLSIDLGYLLKDLAEREKSPIIDLLRVLKDPYVTRLLSIMIMLELVDKNVTRVVATAEAVLPIATMLSLEFGASVVLVKRKSYPGVQYYSVMVMRGPRDVETLYLDKDLITRKDKVLVISDVVYTGKTLESVLHMLMKSRAEILNVIVVMGLGTAWEERLQQFKVKVLSMVPFEI